jgi:hypothetical protein
MPPLGSTSEERGGEESNKLLDYSASPGSDFAVSQLGLGRTVRIPNLRTAVPQRQNARGTYRTRRVAIASHADIPRSRIHSGAAIEASTEK